MWRSVNRGREYVCWKESGKQRRKLAHRWEWEQANGPIPDGYEIHHVDHDPLNNDLSNLLCVTAEWHDDYHQRLREDHIVVDGVEHRRCQRCGEYRPFQLFAKRSAGTFGGYCKDCGREYMRVWREKNREHWNLYHRQYRAKKRAER